MNRICQKLGEQMGALYECGEKSDGLLQIRTPFMYPDGDYVDLYLRQGAGSATLTDYGETLRWLEMQSGALQITSKRRRLINDVCMTQGVEFFQGALVSRLESEDEIAQSVVRLGEACVRVSDLWFTFRNRSVETTGEEVESFLDERGIPFDRNVKLPGRSGKSWRVDFQTRTSQQSSLIKLLTTGSRSSASTLSKTTLAMWVDLSNFRLGESRMQFITLIDDTVDVWRDEDFQLVENASTVARWADPDDFEEQLRAA